MGRDQFLQNAGKIFEMPKTAHQQGRLERENERLKAMLGELTMELKKATGKASSPSPRRSEKALPTNRCSNG